MHVHKDQVSVPIGPTSSVFASFVSLQSSRTHFGLQGMKQLKSWSILCFACVFFCFSSYLVASVLVWLVIFQLFGYLKFQEKIKKFQRKHSHNILHICRLSPQTILRDMLTWHPCLWLCGSCAAGFARDVCFQHYWSPLFHLSNMDICLKIRWPETTWESHIQLDLRNEKQVDDFSQIAAIKPVMCSWSSACLILVLQKQRWVEVAEAVTMKNRHSSHLRHRFRFCISKAVAFCHFVAKMLMSNQSQFHIASWENVLIAGNVLLSASSTTQRT